MIRGKIAGMHASSIKKKARNYSPHRLYGKGDQHHPKGMSEGVSSLGVQIIGEDERITKILLWV